MHIHHQSNRIAAVVRTAALGLGLIAAAGCANAETHVVEMLKYKFVPEEITVKAGDTVRWLNTERRQYHTIWFKAQGEDENARTVPRRAVRKDFRHRWRISLYLWPSSRFTLDEGDSACRPVSTVLG